MKFLTVIVLFCVLVFTSCLTMANTSTPAKESISTSWIFDKEDLELKILKKNEIVYRDIPSGLPDSAEIKLFGKINWFNAILDGINLHETMSLDNKKQLFKALFGKN